MLSVLITISGISFCHVINISIGVPPILTFSTVSRYQEWAGHTPILTSMAPMIANLSVFSSISAI